jgi:Matrixin
MRTPMLNAMSTYDAVSVLWVLEWSGDNADVNTTTGFFGNTGWWAYGACSVSATFGGTDPNRWCQPQVITFNTNHPSNWYGTSTGRGTVACHELGHTLGLRHSLTSRASCMRNAVLSPATIHSHDNDTLNNHYD